MKVKVLALLLTAAAMPAKAEPNLPPDALVREALEAHPSVQAARLRIEVAKADERGLKVGPHEFVATGSYISRSVDREGRFDEYDALLSRGIRLPGKARLDRKVGAFGVEAAENIYEDARHQAALLLNELWWDWLGTHAEAEVDALGIANYETALRSVKRRVELRDAAQLESDQVEGALSDAKLAAAQTKGRSEFAKARLIAQFPSLALPAEPFEVPLPEVPAGGLMAMHDQVIDRSHEIGAAQAQASRLAALAERTNRDRIADPSLGIRIFSERSGAERGAGLVLSMPLGGGQRKATAAKASSEAQAGAAELNAVRFNVQEMADGDVVRADAAIAAWHRSREAVKAQMAALQKLRRGQQLGAIDLADVLFGERQTHAAFRAEAVARTEAVRALNRLRIDSHNLWISE
jgi:outer membrane protein, heavy metal efflux system